MPRGHATDLDARASRIPGFVNRDLELTYLRAGFDPAWERPSRNGADITDRPDLWTPYQRQRREAFDARVAEYRASGLL